MTFVAGTVLTAAALNSELAAKTDTAMTQNAQTGSSYSYALADASKLLTTSNASAVSVTVTKQATVTWVTGTQLRIMNLGAGVTTLVADTGVTINGNKALAQYQGGTLIRTSSDVWTFVPTSSAAGVLQVKSTAKTDTFTMSSATLADVTGLSVAITPSSASNKVLVTVHMSFGAPISTTGLNAALFRDATQIALGDAAGSRLRRVWPRAATLTGDGQAGGTLSMTFLDSPATTSATTYKMQIASDQAVAIYVNRTPTEADTNVYARGISTITAMEVTP